MKLSNEIFTYITIVFKFDCCPDENYWQIIERRTGIIHRSGSYVGNVAHSLLVEKVRLRSDREYILTMYDKGSNGLQDGDSYYEIYSGIAEDGWIQRALLGRVTGNFGFSLEHIIPMEYAPDSNQKELLHFQNDAYSPQQQNPLGLVVMFSVFITFLVLGFAVGIFSFGRRNDLDKSNSKAEKYGVFSDGHISHEHKFLDIDRGHEDEENTLSEDDFEY